MPTLKEYAASLPEDVRADYLSQLERVESTITATRRERDELAGKIKNVPSDVSDLQSKLDSATRKVTFLENAAGKGVKDTRLAWALAQTEGTFKDDGAIDWAKLKELSPALFTAPVKTAAGSGTATEPQGVDVNTRIRQAAKSNQ